MNLKSTRLIELVMVGLLVACTIPAQPYTTQIIPTTGQQLSIPPADTLPVQDTVQPAVSTSSAPPTDTAGASPIPGSSPAEDQQVTVTVTGDQRLYLPTVVRDGKVPQLFGVSVVPMNDQGGLTVIKNAGTVWTRAGVHWNSVERTQGVWNWNDPVFLQSEADIKAAADKGYRIVVLLGETPEWAVKPGFTCGAIREDLFGDFITYAKEVVRRFSASPYKVEYFELYNEPDAANVLGCWGDVNDPQYYGGQYYGTFLKAVYTEMKAVNPNAKIMVGGLLLDCNPNLNLVINNQLANCTPSRFLEGILVSGAKDSFDGVAFHAYDYFQANEGTGEEWYASPGWASSWDTTGPVTLAKAKFIRALLDQYGAHNKFLMNTEIAVLCGVNDPEKYCANWLRGSKVKTYYPVYAFVSSIVDGYVASIWYSALGDARGNDLLNPDLAPTPAFNAYKFMATMLQDAHYSGPLPLGEDVTGYLFTNNGKRILVMWANDRLEHTINLSVPPSAMYRIGDDGNPVSLDLAQSVTVTLAPVFVEIP